MSHEELAKEKVYYCFSNLETKECETAGGQIIIRLANQSHRHPAKEMQMQAVPNKAALGLRGIHHAC